MKPLGMYLAITGTDSEPRGIDDDYDWHRRQSAAKRLAAVPSRKPRSASIAERLRMLVRARTRAVAPTARRA